MMDIAIFWFRRDLRTFDNAGLFHALSNHNNVLPIFILDDNIVNELPKDDARISLIYNALSDLNKGFKAVESGLKIYRGNPLSVFKEITDKHNVYAVYTNKDYEPYAIKRDQEVREYLSDLQIPFKAFKDQVIFEESEIIKDNGTPYTVYTPYSKKWLSKFKFDEVPNYPSEKQLNQLAKINDHVFPTLGELGFEASKIKVPDINLSSDLIANYKDNRDFPTKKGTSLIGSQLRFGTISIRKLVRSLQNYADNTFLKELIWREFFMQILYHFPKVVNQSFKAKYDNIKWINDETKFQKWCEGKTGYMLVDAGMRELNATGLMHNRVRMLVASFLCKHLLIDWRWGEAYFASKLLDFELSSNNGNWQWAAGCGCDAAPYFRVFNPYTQQEKFDPNFEYIKKWVPELNTSQYPEPIVEHKSARQLAIDTYKVSLNQ